MIITKVKIINFKIFKNQTFEFGDNKFILITGANGFGKTTLIDAIEWCLTGTITRIKKCYERRNSTKNEKKRKENMKGIIKNFECSTNDKIKVSITLNIDNEEFVIYREQKDENLFSSTELKFEKTNISENLKSEILDNILDKEFYNYYICDVHKSYNLLNSSRTTIKNEFEEFMKPWNSANDFIRKLRLLSEQIDKKIENQKEYLISEKKITDIKKENENIKKELNNLFDYPQIKFYEAENLNIYVENKSKIEKQLNLIKNCGYKEAYLMINELILYYKNYEKVVNLKELLKLKENINENDFNFIIENKYFKKENQENLSKMIKTMKVEKKKVQNSKELSDLDALDQNIFEDKLEFKIKKMSLSNHKNELVKFTNKIKDYEKGNEIIIALSSLISNTNGIIKYKNEGYNKCPLCGIETKFKDIVSENELAIEASLYLDKNSIKLVEMKKEEKKLINIYYDDFKNFKECIERNIDNKLKVLNQENIKLIESYKKGKYFFDSAEKMNIEVNYQMIQNIKRIIEKKNQLLASEESIISILNKVKKIFIILNYDENLENINANILEKIKIDIENYFDKNMELSKFNIELFNKKIFCMKNVLKNKTINKKEEELKKFISKNINIKEKIEQLNKYKSNINSRINALENYIAQYEKLELEAVGPYLYNIFIKIIKHTKIKMFNFYRDKSIKTGGATFKDESGNNILNILSQGQTEIFILSYFFANIIKRKKETKLKSYFVDDITSCMDDMNVLSFVDMTKYQLYEENGSINQFFFSTCNNDLENLFIQKMQSFNISNINFKFDSYSKGKILINGKEKNKFGYN